MAGGGIGGGIFSPSKDELPITGSTVAANTAGGPGAGVEPADFSALTAVNSTFANEGTDSVPGIHFITSYADLISTTFVDAPLQINGVARPPAARPL
jgi:hypothetical protein